MSLDDRKLEVLRAIVEDYVETQEPVGSKALVDRHKLGLSPATVRNDMAVLEEEGYIRQPHTSAGRVPTDAGYRLFVDRLTKIKPLSPAERRAIERFMVGAVEYLPIILGCVLVAGMSQGFLDANLMPAACTVTNFRHRATAYGLLNFVGTTAGGAMTYVGGMLKEQQVPFATTFQAASLLIFVAGLCLFAVKPTRSEAGEPYASAAPQPSRI